MTSHKWYLTISFLAVSMPLASYSLKGAAKYEAVGSGPSIIGMQHTLAPEELEFIVNKGRPLKYTNNTTGSDTVYGAIRVNYDSPLYVYDNADTLNASLDDKLSSSSNWASVKCGVNPTIEFDYPRPVSPKGLTYELQLKEHNGKAQSRKLRTTEYSFFYQEPAANDVTFVLRGGNAIKTSLDKCTLHIGAEVPIVGDRYGQRIVTEQKSLANHSKLEKYQYSRRMVFIIEQTSSSAHEIGCDNIRASLTRNKTTSDMSNARSTPVQSASILKLAAGRGVVTDDGKYISALELNNLISATNNQPPSFVDALVSAALQANLPEVTKQLATALTDRAKALVNQKVEAQVKGDIPRAVSQLLDIALTYNLTGLVTDSVSGSLPPLLAQSLHESLTFSLAKPAAVFVTKRIQRTVPPLLVPGIARSLCRGLSPLMTRALVPVLTKTLTKSVTHSLAPVLGSSLSRRVATSDVFCSQCFQSGLHCSLCQDSPQSAYYRIYYASYYSDFFSNYYAEYYSNAVSMLDEAIMEQRKGDAAKIADTGKLAEDQTTRTVGGMFKRNM